MQTWVIILIAAVSAILLLMLLLMFFIFNMMFMRRSILKARPFGTGSAYEDELTAGYDWIHEQDAEEVHVVAYDGVRLTGHLITNRRAYRTVILFHGWRGTWDHDFAGIAEWLYEQNSNLLLVEQRGHGNSGGRFTGMGLKERHDVLTWTDWIRKSVSRWHPIYLYGISMGASAVLMASPKLEEGRVNGLIVDCGFTQVYEEVRQYLAQKWIPEHPFMDGVNLMARVFLHLDLRKSSTVRALGKNVTPVLFFHGREDRFVPLSMTEKNYEACRAPKTLCVIDEARHGMSCVIDNRTYHKKLDQFFDQYDREGYLD